MIVIKLMGALQNVLGTNSINFSLPAMISAHHLIQLLTIRHPELAEIIPDQESWNVHLLLLINGAIAQNNTMIIDGDELIFTSGLDGG